MYITAAGISILITIIAIYCERVKEKELNNLQRAFDEERTRNKKDSQKQYELYLAGQEKLSTAVVSATFNCSLEEAKEKYAILKKTYTNNDFIFAESNELRKEIYLKALEEYKNT